MDHSSAGTGKVAREHKMGLYKRSNGKIWWMAYSVDGKQRCESTATGDKRLAQKILDKRKGEIVEARFQLPKSNPPKFKSWAEQFLETISHPNTKRSYSSCVHVLLNFFGDMRISQMSADLIEDFKFARTKAGAGPATINRNLAVLRRMLKLATRQRLIARTPFEQVDFFEERSKRRQAHIMTFEEETRLLAVATPLLRVLVTLLVETGLRVGTEALPLKWSEIDLLDDSVNVRRSKTFAGIRLVPLSGHCKRELLQWQRLAGAAVSDYVFFNPTNPTMHLLKLPKTWKRALKNAKIEYFPIYNLRHTFASRMNAAGTTQLTISQMLGHSSVSIVQTYAKLVDENRRDAIQKLTELRQTKEMVTESPSPQSLHIN
jgi:integrase